MHLLNFPYICLQACRQKEKTGQQKTAFFTHCFFVLLCSTSTVWHVKHQHGELLYTRKENLICFVYQAPQSSLARRQQRQQRVYNMMKDLQQKHLATIMQGKISDQENSDLSESQSICRICHSSGEEALITPCYCSGSAKHVHASCLLTWFKKEVKNTCELCRHKVSIKKKGKPYAEVIHCLS